MRATDVGTGRQRVLYIGGTGRTGSTLVEKVLGQFEGFFAAGELTWLWYGLLGDGRCSCGDRLVDCPIWSAVLARVFPGGLDLIEIRRLFELRRRYDSRWLPILAVPGAHPRLVRRLEELVEVLDRLYTAIADVTGARVIVDSSKEPHYSVILDGLPNLDLAVLHLVRDPRAIAYSWSRSRPERGFDGRVEMERRSAAVSAAYHDVSNLATELWWRRRAGRYLRLRYEAFVADPSEAIRAVGGLVGEELDPGTVLDGRTARVGAIHSAWGNPNRFDSGTVTIRSDDEWRDAMPTGDRRVSTMLTLPFLLHYGYPLRSGRGSLHRAR